MLLLFICSDTSLRLENSVRCLLTPCRAALWGGFRLDRLPIVCVLEFVGVSVGTTPTCRLHVPTPTPTNLGTPRSGNRKPPQRLARHGARRHRTEFSNLKKVSGQIWLSYFWNVFYKRTETNAKQTVRFNSRQTICLEQFLLPLFYSFPLYIFNTFLHILSHFIVRHIFINFNLC